MSAPFPEPIQSAVESVIKTYEIPGISVRAVVHDKAFALDTGTDAHGAPVTADSLFCVASITKLATALSVLRLVDTGACALDDPLKQYLPQARAAHGEITLRELLCHVSGLPVDLPNEHELYGTELTWEDLAGECLRVEPERPPRTRVVYGNVGYGLLALTVESLTGQKFHDILADSVLKPLGMEAYLGDLPPRPPVQLADVRSRHAGTDLEPYNSEYYLTLGLPWSGLVTTADSALKLVRAYAGEPADFLSPALCREATQNQTGDLPGGYGARFDYPRAPWGLGVDLRGDKKPHWTPANASPRTFGHAGASGCVVWHDPDTNISWAILGTRTADNAWLVRGGAKLGEEILRLGHAAQ